MLLDGKVAIITGAGTGLGKTTAVVFAKEGAKIGTIGRRLEKLKDVEAEVQAIGGEIIVHEGDMALQSDVKALVKETAGRFGGVDIVINNAGLHSAPRYTHEVPLQEFDDFINVNLRGPFMLIQEAVPYMLKAGGGSIINIGSMVGMVGVRSCVSYGTVKGAMINMTRTIAMDYADKGIRVNCVSTGGMLGTENRLKMTPEQSALIGSSICKPATGRSSSTEDVAQLLLFLAGPYSTNITGANIPHDGGATAR